MNQPMKMNWQQLYSPLRTGAVTPSQNEFSAEIARSADPNVRTSFLRDYDRLIFSSAFRRLQKTASDRNLKLVEVARMILTAEEAFGAT